MQWLLEEGLSFWFAGRPFLSCFRSSQKRWSEALPIPQPVTASVDVPAYVHC